MLINGSMEIIGQYVPSEAAGIPNYSAGFGRINLFETVHWQELGHILSFYNENRELDTAEEDSRTISVESPNRTLKATLVWTDPSGDALQNDLDLIVQAPNGIDERHGNQPPTSIAFDRTNNVEQIVWENIPQGNVTIIVKAYRIAIHPQSYSLVIRLS